MKYAEVLNPKSISASAWSISHALIKHVAFQQKLETKT